MKVAGCIKWKRIAALAILVTFFCPATAHLEGIATQYNDENNILWPKSPLYDHAVNDADVRDVLTQIISTAGFRYVFKPGVRGTITYKFRSIALGSAFDRIIELSGLQYSYDPYSQTITILPALEQAEELIELNRVDPRAVKQAAVRLDIGGEIKADTQRRVVYIRGSLKQVQALRDLVQTLENKEKSNLAEVVTLSKINADEVKSAAAKPMEGFSKAKTGIQPEIIAVGDNKKAVMLRGTADQIQIMKDMIRALEDGRPTPAVAAN